MRNTNENLAQFEVVNAAQKKVTAQLNPRIDLQIMAPLMQKLRSLLKPPLRNYTLDSLPPVFQDMKDYVIDEKESLTDISMKWAGNSNITVTVQAFMLRAIMQRLAELGSAASNATGGESDDDAGFPLKEVLLCTALLECSTIFFIGFFHIPEISRRKKKLMVNKCIN